MATATPPPPDSNGPRFRRIDAADLRKQNDYARDLDEEARGTRDGYDGWRSVSPEKQSNLLARRFLKQA